MAMDKRKKWSARPKAAFKSSTWRISTTRPQPSARVPTTTVRVTADPIDTQNVTKSQSCFASLFISLLAVSPMAVEYDAADENTMQSAQKAAVQPTRPAPTKKTHTRVASGVRTADIRKTRWKRFKYEVQLKMKSKTPGGRKDKGKERGQWSQAEDVEMERLGSHQRRVVEQRA